MNTELRDYDMTRLNPNKIVFYLKTAEFYPNECMCFYNISLMNMQDSTKKIC